ncbi:MAG: hypothetical protein E7212_14090 [Clostridium sartagoforme]|nr:hypothetical protein [Clostridium sartagoforme]
MKINIRKNKYGIDINDLISIGYRINNRKRNFLFISKVLGKHIEIRSDMCKVIGLLLASTIFPITEETSLFVNYIKNQKDYELQVKESIGLTYKTNEKVAVLGFAETATGLGLAVASSIENSYYITTTREDIKDMKSFLNFEEEHSHATTHRCYPEEPSKLIEVDRIILVDDEITTGKSMLNIISELILKTNVKKYTVLSILDWRSIEYRELYKEFINKNNIDIEVKSLISGDIKIENNKIFLDTKEDILNEEMAVTNLNIMSRKGNYLRYTGRFGIDFREIGIIEEECIKVANKIQEIIGENKKILVLGHGENIYIPSRVASYLQGDIYFKTTTRSPIYCSKEEGYLISEKSIFFHNKSKYYFYNKTDIEENYDYVVLITEDDLNIKLTNKLIIVKP